jgi:hypothetical protein
MTLVDRRTARSDPPSCASRMVGLRSPFTMPSAHAAVKDAPRRFAVPPSSASLTAAPLRANRFYDRRPDVPSALSARLTIRSHVAIVGRLEPCLQGRSLRP